MEAYEDLFDLYINDKLTAADKATFEQRLANDEEFRLEYERHLDISKSVKHLGKSVIIEQLQEIEYNLRSKGSLEDYKPTKNSKGGFGAGNIWIWLLFATLAIGIAVAAYFVSSDPHLASGKNYFKSCNQLYVKIIDDRELDNYRIAYNKEHCSADTLADNSDTAFIEPKYFNDTVNVCIIYRDSFNFHYTYTDDSLILYGNLMQSLIQFASKPKHKYEGYYNLIYNGELFELIPNTTKISPLKRINSSAPALPAQGQQQAEDHIEIYGEDDEVYYNNTPTTSNVVESDVPSPIRWDSVIIVKLIPIKSKQHLDEPSAWGPIIKRDTIKNGEIHITRKMQFRDMKKFQDKYSVVLVNLNNMKTESISNTSSVKQKHKTTGISYNYKVVLPGDSNKSNVLE